VNQGKFTPTALSLIIAAALWILIFLIRPANFWIMLAASTFILLVLSFAINKDRAIGRIDLRSVMLGLLSAVLLYGFFFVGFQVTKSIPFLNEGVSSVYELRSSTPLSLIAGVLIFPIGPGEEFYWRGLVQRRFSERFGPNTGFVVATAAYSLVHLLTLNPTLIMTALICGSVWGFLYRRTGSLIPSVTSHVLWDLLIFVVAPLS
jgi:membrane protease YdiL (CAAX protease family)